MQFQNIIRALLLNLFSLATALPTDPLYGSHRNSTLSHHSGTHIGESHSTWTHRHQNRTRTITHTHTHTHSGTHTGEPHSTWRHEHRNQTGIKSHTGSHTAEPHSSWRHDHHNGTGIVTQTGTHEHATRTHSHTGTHAPHSFTPITNVPYSPDATPNPTKSIQKNQNIDWSTLPWDDMGIDWTSAYYAGQEQATSTTMMISVVDVIPVEATPGV